MIDHQKVTLAFEVFDRHLKELLLFDLILYRYLRNTCQTLTVLQDTLDRFGVSKLKKDIEIIHLLFDVVQKDLSRTRPLFAKHPALGCKLIDIGRLGEALVCRDNHQFIDPDTLFDDIRSGDKPFDKTDIDLPLFDHLGDLFGVALFEGDLDIRIGTHIAADDRRHQVVYDRGTRTHANHPFVLRVFKFKLDIRKLFEDRIDLLVKGTTHFVEHQLLVDAVKNGTPKNILKLLDRHRDCRLAQPHLFGYVGQMPGFYDI